MNGECHGNGLDIGTDQDTDLFRASRVVYLKPNEKALFNKESGIITVEKTDNRFETAWLRRRSRFPINDIK